MIYLVYEPHSPAQIEVSDSVYRYVVVKNDVAILCLSDEEAFRVPNLMSKRRDCSSCGNNERKLFRKASEEEIKIWNGN